MKVWLIVYLIYEILGLFFKLNFCILLWFIVVENVSVIFGVFIVIKVNIESFIFYIVLWINLIFFLDFEVYVFRLNWFFYLV